MLVFSNTLVPKESKGLFDLYLKDQRDIETTFNMLSIFEHDRDAVVVTFPNKRDMKANPEAHEELIKTGERIVEVKIKYSSIRRLIVTLHHNEKDGVTATFYFQLRHPVMIYIYEAFKDKEGKHRFRGSNRWLTWMGKELEKAVAHASTFVLECFDVKVSFGCDS